MHTGFFYKIKYTYENGIVLLSRYFKYETIKYKSPIDKKRECWTSELLYFKQYFFLFGKKNKYKTISC